MSVKEMRSLIMEFSREKENFLTMVVEQRLVIKSLSLRVEKLKGATKGSANGEEISMMRVHMIVDESPSTGEGKIIEENPSKRNNGEKIEIKRARIGYGDKVCYHCHKRDHI